MRKLMILGLAGLTLAGCSHHGGTGLNRSRPDEFAVAREAPLVVPPDFGLTPPAPGAPRPQDADSSTQALQALFGGPAPRSALQTGTLNNAGAGNAAGGIRSNVADPNTSTVDKGSATQDVVAAPEGDGQTARASAGK